MKFGATNPGTYSPLADSQDGMSLLILADVSGTLFSRLYFVEKIKTVNTQIYIYIIKKNKKKKKKKKGQPGKISSI
jgi:hypothetical protein